MTPVGQPRERRGEGAEVATLCACGLHDECRISWCACACHPRPAAPVAGTADDGARAWLQDWWASHPPVVDNPEQTALTTHIGRLLDQHDALVAGISALADFVDECAKGRGPLAAAAYADIARRARAVLDDATGSRS